MSPEKKSGWKMILSFCNGPFLGDICSCSGVYSSTSAGYTPLHLDLHVQILSTLTASALPPGFCSTIKEIMSPSCKLLLSTEALLSSCATLASHILNLQMTYLNLMFFSCVFHIGFFEAATHQHNLFLLGWFAPPPPPKHTKLDKQWLTCHFWGGYPCPKGMDVSYDPLETHGNLQHSQAPSLAPPVE